MTATEFKPDWVSPPGDTIRDMLISRGMSQLAILAGYAPKLVRDLMTGDARIGRRRAQDLEVFIGGTQKFWLARERNYRAALKRLASEG